MTIKDVRVKCLCDFECITHVATKGTVITIPSNFADELVEQGKAVVVTEMSEAKPAAEKRG